MSMNKIKTRHVGRAMHAKRRGKHTTCKGYAKYKKHYTQKNVKQIHIVNTFPELLYPLML